MTQYMQRKSKSNRVEFPYPLVVAFRANLVNIFYDLVGKDMKDIGAHCFGHTLIKTTAEKKGIW